MLVPRERLLALFKLRCSLFGAVFNPDGLRIGTKVLRQRLRGPSLVTYYPRKGPQIKDLNRLFGPHLMTTEPEQVAYDEWLQGRRERGKARPRKLTSFPIKRLKKKSTTG